MAPWRLHLFEVQGLGFKVEGLGFKRYSTLCKGCVLGRALDLVLASFGLAAAGQISFLHEPFLHVPKP